jgi:rhodanese-related sulfurtransferase
MVKTHSPRFLELVNNAKTRIREMTVAELGQKQASGDGFLLVDVREESEWAAGHAKGAVYLGKGILERDVEGIAPDTGTELVLYCGGGFRSALSADALQTMGYTRVWSLAGGWRAYRESGLPVEP